MDLFFTASLLLCTVSAVWSAGNVFQLNEQDFGRYLQDKNVMLVDFYAPWCPHCKELDPELNAAADAMAAKNSYVFAKVDCTNDGKSLCERMQVPGYPTLKVFKYGRWVGDYTGGHDRGSILNYVESVTSPAAQQAGLTSQPNNIPPASLGQAIESRPQPAGGSVQAFQPQVPYQSQLSYQSPQLQGARPATPYFNGFVNKNPAANANPSLLGSFYKAPQKPLYAATKAPEQQPSRSPDSLREKFGSLAALRVYQAKLKMLAAYKNWHKRIRIFQQRVKEFKAQQQGNGGTKLTTPSQQIAAYQGTQQLYNNFAGAPYNHAAPQAAPAQYYQPYTQYQPSYRSKLKRRRPRKERVLPLAAGHHFRVQPQDSARTSTRFQARPQTQRPFAPNTNPRFQAQFQTPYANRPAVQAARMPYRITQQEAQIQRQQQLYQQAPVGQQGAINSPEAASRPSENLESLKVDLANSLADFAKHEKSKTTSVKAQNQPKPHGPQTPHGSQTPQNTEVSKEVNTNPDNQDLSSLGLDAESGKTKEKAVDEEKLVPAEVLSKDADANNTTDLSVQETDDKNTVKSDTKNKAKDKAKDAEKGKPKEADEEIDMNDDSSSGDMPEKKDQIAKAS